MEEKNTDEPLSHVCLRYLAIIVITVAAMIFLYTKILINAYIPSDSMENTLMTGDRLIGNRIAYQFGNNPERYDIIMFYAPDEPDEVYIKRVIGLPGETVLIKDGKVYINGSHTALDDSFIREEMEEEPEMEFHVPEDSYFMLGDNRNESLDSRYWDNPYEARSSIVAKAWFRYWKGFKMLD